MRTSGANALGYTTLRLQTVRGPGSGMSGLKTVSRTLLEEPVRRSLFRILRENALCSMSTVATGNRAHINTAYFCYSRALELFFLSDPGSLHSRSLAKNPSMAMTIFRSAQSWGRPDRGAQLFGTCREAKGPHARNAERLYGERFPPYARTLEGRTSEARRQAEQLRSYRFYRFVPTRVKILDERVFGGGVFVVASVPRRRSR